MVTNRLTAVLPLSYTFTGAARNATITLANNTDLVLVQNGSTASFVPSNVTFVRARLVASGAQGLEPAVGEIAGKLALRFKGATKNSAPFTLSFTKWNEWENPIVSTYTGECDGGSIGLELLASGTVLTLDDYNVQEAYVGQNIEPILEIEVECNGINVA